MSDLPEPFFSLKCALDELDRYGERSMREHITGRMVSDWFDAHIADQNRITELEANIERLRSPRGALRTLRSHIADYDQMTYAPLAAALDVLDEAYPWDEGADDG